MKYLVPLALSAFLLTGCVGSLSSVTNAVRIPFVSDKASPKKTGDKSVGDSKNRGGADSTSIRTSLAVSGGTPTGPRDTPNLDQF